MTKDIGRQKQRTADSPCEIGLTFVSGGQIVETKSWLMKPMYDEFDYFSILIHGIRPEHVADKPEFFNELWTESAKFKLCASDEVFAPKSATAPSAKTLAVFLMTLHNNRLFNRGVFQRKY